MRRQAAVETEVKLDTAEPSLSRQIRDLEYEGMGAARRQRAGGTENGTERLATSATWEPPAFGHQS
jgi:hypothetical protein